MRTPATASAFDIACRWLARAVRSEADVRARLIGLGFSEPAVDKSLRRLRELAYLDDARLARERALLLAGRGYGDAWIACDLRRRGIVDAEIAGALGGLDPETERAARWLRQGSREGKRRAAWRALVQRGFSEETAEAVLNSAGAAADDSTAE